MRPHPEVEHEEEDELPQYSGPSKSQRKRDSHALQDLGKELTSLSSDRLKKLDLPDALLGALLEWQRLTKHEAKRRQLQYIGKIMRDVDVDPIRAALDEIKGVSVEATARMHRLEHLREQLLADEQVLQDILEEYPDADIKHLRQLRRNALREQELTKPPKSFREIYRILRDLDAAQRNAEAAAQAEAVVDDEDDY